MFGELPNIPNNYDVRPDPPPVPSQFRAVTIVANAWRPFGLRADPYFQEALTPEADADHPTTLFVGRAEELRLLGSQMLGATSSRAVVQGPFGVGKTSFVNRLKTLVAEHGVLTHAAPVRVTGDMTPQGFTAEVLRALTQVRASQRAAPRAPAAAGAPASTLPEAPEATAFWRRLGRLLEGEDLIGGGVSLAGMGASVTRGRIAAERREVSLYPELEQAVAYLAGAGTLPPGGIVPGGIAGGAGAAGRSDASRRAAGTGRSRSRAVGGRVLIHVNNFENLTRTDTARAAGLVQDLRDYFLIPHSHWVFVGAANLETDVFRASAAVSGIVPIVADLPPLTADEVAALLARRYERLRVGLRFVEPVAPAAVAELYDRYGGDLRNFLRLLSNAVQRRPIAERPEPLTARAAVQTMAPTYRRTLVRQLGEVDAGHLAVLVEGGAPGMRVRSADIAARTGLAKASVTELLGRLEARGAIRHDATEGRSTYYRLHPDVEVAFALG